MDKVRLLIIFPIPRKNQFLCLFTSTKIDVGFSLESSFTYFLIKAIHELSKFLTTEKGEILSAKNWNFPNEFLNELLDWIESNSGP